MTDEHLDVVSSRHRFGSIVFGLVEWDLTHLEPFALRVEISPDLVVDLVVFFSCHCFTAEEQSDPRYPHVPASEYYDDGHEVRVLNQERYILSRQFLPQLIRDLANRQIRVQSARSNFFTFESTSSNGQQVHYVVFFDVERDRTRKKRMLLRVQSAFPMASFTDRLGKAGKVRFPVLLRAVYEGRSIRG